MQHLHQNLAKHQSTAITQLRTGCTGLRAFLFYRGVPDAVTPLCRCGAADETVNHAILECPLRERPYTTAPVRTRRDLVAALSLPDSARDLASWFLSQRVSSQFDLALRLGGDSATRRARSLLQNAAL